MENYINFSIGYEYDDNFVDEDNKIKNKIIDFIKSIVPNEENENQTKYLIKITSSCLKGENEYQKCWFFLGEGGNGKGTYFNLAKNTLGNYFGDLKMAYFTTYDKGEDSPNNNLINIQYSRGIISSEVPDKDHGTNNVLKFNESRFKNLTGQDNIITRGCFDKEITTFKAGKLFILTNNMVEFTKYDNAIIRRIDIINFPNKFVDESTLEQYKKEGKEDIDNYKLGDPNINQFLNSKEARQVFIRILLEEYKNSDKFIINTPSFIMKNNKNYFDEVNNIKTWVEQNIIKTDNDKDYLYLSSSIIEHDSLYTNYIKEVQKCTSKEFMENIKALNKYTIKFLNGKKILRGYKYIEKEN